MLVVGSDREVDYQLPGPQESLGAQVVVIFYENPSQVGVLWRRTGGSKAYENI